MSEILIILKIILKLVIRLIFFVGILIYIVLLSYIVINLFFEPDYTIQDQCRECNNIYGSNNDYTADLIKQLDTIKKNCGSTFVTKRYNDSNYYIFKKSYKDGWEKSEYILLEDCLE